MFISLINCFWTVLNYYRSMLLQKLKMYSLTLSDQDSPEKEICEMEEEEEDLIAFPWGQRTHGSTRVQHTADTQIKMVKSKEGADNKIILKKKQTVSSPFLPSYTKSYSQTRFEVTTSDYTWEIDQFGRLSAIVDTLNSPPFGENNQYKIQMNISRKDLLCAIRISIRTSTAFKGSCTTTIMHPPERARSEATFRYTVENISKMKDSQLSPAFYVRNLPWKIKVYPPRSSQTQERQRSLGFYLLCDGDSKSTSWSCCSVVELRLLSCKEGQEPESEKFQHLFNSKSKSLGFPDFMRWQDVLDPDRGFIKDDSITLEAHVVADAVLSSRSFSGLISDMTLLIDISDRSYISTEAFIIHCKIKNFHQLISNTIHMNLQASAPVFKEVKSLEDSTFEFAMCSNLR